MKLLRTISLTNFKGISNVDIALSKLNLFVGENGTGKSSVIQALSLLKRSLGQAAIITDLPYLNLGPPHEIVPPAKTAAIGVEGTSPIELAAIEAENVEFRCTVKFDTQGLSAYETEISPQQAVIDLKVRNTWYRYGVSGAEPASWQYKGITFQFSPTNVIGEAFTPAGYSHGGKMTPDKAEVAQNMQKCLRRLSGAIRMNLEKIYVVPTTRGLTEPSYPLQSGATSDFSPRSGPIPMGTGLASNLAYFSHNEDKISRWQQEILGVGVKYHLEPGPTIIIRNPENEVSYVNEGFGSNQMLFILERIANSPEESLIAIEEPEIHVHPKAQFRFGSLACQIVKDEKKQLVLTTHSEHVISGVLTAIRNGKLKPQDVSIWFFERKDLQNTATRSEIDKEGKTVGALQSFLEAAVEELSEYIKETR